MSNANELERLVTLKERLLSALFLTVFTQFAVAADPADLFLDIVQKTQERDQHADTPASPLAQAPTQGQTDREIQPSKMRTDQQPQTPTHQADLEKAWNCDPVIEGKSYSFNNTNCAPPKMAYMEGVRLILVLIAEYGYESSGAFRKEWLRRDGVAKQKAYEEANAPKLARQRDLKGGRAKISSYEDALLFYESRNLSELMERPLLAPDSGYYAGAVVIEGQERQNLLRVKITLSDGPHYAFLRIWPQTIN